MSLVRPDPVAPGGGAGAGPRPVAGSGRRPRGDTTIPSTPDRLSVWRSP